MALTQSNARYCIIEPDKGAVSIKLIGDNSLVLGADFVLFEADRTSEAEKFKMSVQGNTYHAKRMASYEDTMHKCVLAWSILVCSLDPKVHTGNIELQVLQQGLPCSITPPAKWSAGNIPPCAVKSTTNIDGNLTFILKSSTK